MKLDEAMEYDAAKLKRWRLRRRWTQAELARRAGISIGAVSEIEAGNAPWLKAIRALENALGIEVIDEEFEELKSRGRGGDSRGRS
jgi:transcriptional regulator with XRE-family HTH domain